mgnify:FL=1
MAYLLGIDIGTTNIKTLLLDAASGNIAAIESCSYEIDMPKKEYAEYDPEKWYEHCCKCLKKMMRDHGVKAEHIKAVGVSGQMHGLVAVDRAGIPVYPAILHCDTRSSEQLQMMREKIGEKTIREELMNPLYTGFLLPSLCWIRDKKPELYSKIRHVMLPKDYINFKLTGNLVTDYSDASATLAFDVRNGCWSDHALKPLNIAKELFPEIKNSCDRIGAITEKASRETGLKTGTIVVGGGGDAIMQSLGNGIIDERYAVINVGTSGQVLFSSSSVLGNPDLAVNTFCGWRKGSWISMGAIMSAGAAYKWVTNVLSENNYKEFDQKIHQIPVGSKGLVFLPHLNGERTPYLDPTLRGALLGISLDSGKEEIGRAVMEGVSFALRLCYDVCLKKGLDAETFIISGGGSKSRVWTQMLSDIFNKPVKVSKMEEQAAVGAAMCAGIGAQIYADMRDAVMQVVEISDETCTPSDDRHKMYMKYYELFKSAYISNKELLKEIYNQSRKGE